MYFKEELIVIRHARSLNNIRASDDLDSDLTDWGHRQAANVGRFLANHMHIDDSWGLFTSPFLRCLKTTAAIAAPLKMHFPVVQPTLREYINHGGREVRIPSRHREYPQFMWSHYPAETVFLEEFTEELFNRMHEAFQLLPQKSIVVTHGLPAQVLLAIAQNPTAQTIPVYDHSLDNASISYVVRGRPVWWGRNLHHELDYDPLDQPRPYDKCDLLKPPKDPAQ